MIKIKTLEEIELMRESALIVSKTLGEIAKEIKGGGGGQGVCRTAGANPDRGEWRVTGAGVAAEVWSSDRCSDG